MGGVLVRGEGGTGRMRRWGRECIERRQGVCRGRAHGRRARGTPSGAGRGLPGLGPWLGQDEIGGDPFDKHNHKAMCDVTPFTLTHRTRPVFFYTLLDSVLLTP